MELPCERLLAQLLVSHLYQERNGDRPPHKPLHQVWAHSKLIKNMYMENAANENKLNERHRKLYIHVKLGMQGEQLSWCI